MPLSDHHSCNAGVCFIKFEWSCTSPPSVPVLVDSRCSLYQTMPWGSLNCFLHSHYQIHKLSKQNKYNHIIQKFILIRCAQQKSGVIMNMIIVSLMKIIIIVIVIVIIIIIIIIILIMILIITDIYFIDTILLV